MDSIESPSKKVVRNPLRSSTEVQIRRKMIIYEAMQMTSEISKADASRFQALTDNNGIFFFSFELDFNRFIHKAKEFFPNIDMNFLTLIDLDFQSSIKYYRDTLIPL